MMKCTYDKDYPDADMPPGCRETAACPMNDSTESCAYCEEDDVS